MTNIFRTVLNMSLTGSYVILAVLLARLLLKKAPRKYSLALWAAAAFRLCCPVSFESILSVFRLPLFDMTAAQAPVPGQLTYISADATQPVITGVVAMNSYMSPVVTPSPAPAVSVDWMTLWAWVWLGGMAVMLLWSLGAWWKLRRRVETAIRIKDQVYRSDAMDSPFILGLFRPKIYLPAALSEKEQEYVLAHERTHLKKGDHFLKFLAYGILTVHWFNPLCHLAFRLMSRDLEIRCDEAVLARQPEIRKDYSATLVNLAVRPGTFPASPLAFGETAVRSRVKHILNWKKPALWITIVATLVSSLCLVSCAANPAQHFQPAPEEMIFGQEYRCFDNVATTGAYGWTGNYMTYTGQDSHIDENGNLFLRFSSYKTESEWRFCGKLESFTLTEENFDALFGPVLVGGQWNSYDELFTLRQRTLNTWKAEIPASELYEDSEFYQDRSAFYYVFQIEGGQLFLAHGMYTTEKGLPNGSISRLDCIIPRTADASQPPLAATEYRNSETLYLSPAAKLAPYIRMVRVRNSLLELWDSGDDPSMYDAFYISDLIWQDFPFSQQEWNNMIIGSDELYDRFKDGKYLGISLQYFLLETEGTVYLCYGSHNPASEHSNIQTIYVLEPVK